MFEVFNILDARTDSAPPSSLLRRPERRRSKCACSSSGRHSRAPSVAGRSRLEGVEDMNIASVGRGEQAPDPRAQQRLIVACENPKRVRHVALPPFTGRQGRTRLGEPEAERELPGVRREGTRPRRPLDGLPSRVHSHSSPGVSGVTRTGVTTDLSSERRGPEGSWPGCRRDRIRQGQHRPVRALAACRIEARDASCRAVDIELRRPSGWHCIAIAPARKSDGGARSS